VTAPVVSVVIPTRNRASYLEEVLRSISALTPATPHEVIVVDDGSVDRTSVVADRAGVRYVRHNRAQGINAARNSGVHAATGSLIAFLDDDLWVPPGWLSAIAEGAHGHPQAEAFGGPIRARFEGRTPSFCGREDPPITTLDLGDRDREVDMVWGANLAIRRSAFDRLGLFDERISGHGDEEDWLLGLRASGGQIVYLARAGVDHRRVGSDAALRSLVRAAYGRGRAARVTDSRRGSPPPLTRELRVFLGCIWHGARYRCAQGPIMASHSAGRLVQGLLPPRS
jgi:glycosyltransferase involved in cell wall biosynthesis